MDPVLQAFLEWERHDRELATRTPPRPRAPADPIPQELMPRGAGFSISWETLDDMFGDDPIYQGIKQL